MDSRVIVTRMLQADVGDMFLVRNAGNLVPNNDSLRFDAITTEPGALELGCVINDIRHVLVCGHSDCKVSSPHSATTYRCVTYHFLANMPCPGYSTTFSACYYISNSNCVCDQTYRKVWYKLQLQDFVTILS